MEKVNIKISCKPRYIISTSGRLASLARYNRLLQDVLNTDIVYLPITSSHPNNVIDPQHFCNCLRGMNCVGGAISKDIKHTVIPYLDSIDELSQEIQSVNTVVVRDTGKLHGFNTDALGFREAITIGLKTLPFVVTDAVCYGYGGVTSVVVAVLKSLGITTHLCGRRMEEAAKRADQLSAQVWQKGVTHAQLFVNATPVTDKPLEDAANFLDALQGCQVAFDHEMPGESLRSYCEEHNIHHISGTEMYYPQMYAQWALFLDGIVEPSQVAEKIARAEELANKIED